MSEPNKIIVIGAGQAGCEVCTELRRQGYGGEIVLIGEETVPPYKRPPLSKAYLAGSIPEDELYVLPEAQLEHHRIQFIHGVRVERIERSTHTVSLSDGRKLGYDKLAITTGGRARQLPVPGADLANVQVLRTLDDVKIIRPHIIAGKRLVIVGGGFVGLEAAAVAVKLGLNVTVLEGLERVLARVTAPEISSFYERVHREAGVDIRTGAQVMALEGSGHVTGVKLQDGTIIPADFVLVGIGLIPNVELAQEAGLEVDNGIVVDEYALTSDPDIASAGDCTNHPSDFAGRRLRLESVPNAMEQGRAAAHNLLGKKQPYQSVPWFWSDQYDLKLQMVGLSTGYDQIVLRGDPATSRSFGAFYLAKGRIIAVDVISRPQDFMVAKKLVAGRVTPDQVKLADETVPLKSLLAPV